MSKSVVVNLGDVPFKGRMLEIEYPRIVRQLH